MGRTRPRRSDPGIPTRVFRPSYVSKIRPSPENRSPTAYPSRPSGGGSSGSRTIAAPAPKAAPAQEQEQSKPKQTKVGGGVFSGKIYSSYTQVADEVHGTKISARPKRSIFSREPTSLPQEWGGSRTQKIRSTPHPVTSDTQAPSKSEFVPTTKQPWTTTKITGSEQGDSDRLTTLQQRKQATPRTTTGINLRKAWEETKDFGSAVTAGTIYSFERKIPHLEGEKLGDPVLKVSQEVQRKTKLPIVTMFGIPTMLKAERGWTEKEQTIKHRAGKQEAALEQAAPQFEEQAKKSAQLEKDIKIYEARETRTEQEYQSLEARRLSLLSEQQTTITTLKETGIRTKTDPETGEISFTSPELGMKMTSPSVQVHGAFIEKGAKLTNMERALYTANQIGREAGIFFATGVGVGSAAKGLGVTAKVMRAAIKAPKIAKVTGTAARTMPAIGVGVGAYEEQQKFGEVGLSRVEGAIIGGVRGGADVSTFIGGASELRSVREAYEDLPKLRGVTIPYSEGKLRVLSYEKGSKILGFDTPGQFSDAKIIGFQRGGKIGLQSPITVKEKTLPEWEMMHDIPSNLMEKKTVDRIKTSYELSSPTDIGLEFRQKDKIKFGLRSPLKITKGEFGLGVPDVPFEEVTESIRLTTPTHKTLFAKGIKPTNTIEEIEAKFIKAMTRPRAKRFVKIRPEVFEPELPTETKTASKPALKIIREELIEGKPAEEYGSLVIQPQLPQTMTMKIDDDLIEFKRYIPSDDDIQSFVSEAKTKPGVEAAKQRLKSELGYIVKTEESGGKPLHMVRFMPDTKKWATIADVHAIDDSEMISDIGRQFGYRDPFPRVKIGKTWVMSRAEQEAKLKESITQFRGKEFSPEEHRFKDVVRGMTVTEQNIKDAEKRGVKGIAKERLLWEEEKSIIAQKFGKEKIKKFLLEEGVTLPKPKVKSPITETELLKASTGIKTSPSIALKVSSRLSKQFSSRPSGVSYPSVSKPSSVSLPSSPSKISYPSVSKPSPPSISKPSLPSYPSTYSPSMPSVSMPSLPSYPSVSVPKASYPKLPPFIPIVPLFGGAGRGYGRKRRGRAGVKYVQDFTSAALGLKPKKVSKRQMRKILGQTFTGLELRGKVIA